MGVSQGANAAPVASVEPLEFRLSRYQWPALISAFLGWMFDSIDLNLFTLVLVCWGGLTFLPSWIHQLSVAAVDHREVGTTVSYTFILMMIGATLGSLTSIGPIAGNAVVAKFGSFPAASAAVSLLFVVGMVSIWFGLETKGVSLDN